MQEQALHPAFAQALLPLGLGPGATTGAHEPPVPGGGATCGCGAAWGEAPGRPPGPQAPCSARAPQRVPLPGPSRSAWKPGVEGCEVVKPAWAGGPAAGAVHACHPQHCCGALNAAEIPARALWWWRSSLPATGGLASTRPPRARWGTEPVPVMGLQLQTLPRRGARLALPHHVAHPHQPGCGTSAPKPKSRQEHLQTQRQCPAGGVECTCTAD